MSETRGRRVVVAVEPLVLEGAFAAILELIALDEVVQFHHASPAERGAPYDAAIVTADFGSEILAEVVITLPDTQDCTGHTGHEHRGHLSTHDVSDDVDIRDQREVIDLLDEHVPARVSRRDRMASAQGGRLVRSSAPPAINAARPADP